LNPEKGKGALQAPIPKLTRLAENSPGHSFTQACRHSVTRTERLPYGHRHFARLACALCGRFLRWFPKPETIARQRVNAFNLAKVAMCEGLNPWQRRFVRDVSKLAKLSPRQQVLVARLVRHYLEGKPS
jgi:hypothetical protein